MGSIGGDILGLAEQKLAWLDRRQRLLANNIANVNTPNFIGHDSTAFADRLGAAAVAGPLVTTQNGALQPHSVRQSAGLGYAVVLDQELIKVADNQTAQAITSNLYSKYLGMFRIALGRAS